MAKILVLYYSAYGHIETMAEAVAEGARQGGAMVDVKRVPELVPEEVARSSHFKLDQKAPIAEPDELVQYDAIIVGTGTRYGRMSSQMANFWDRTGGLWARGALVGKVGAAFTCTGSQHGGQETTLLSILTNLLHQGLVHLRPALLVPGPAQARRGDRRHALRRQHDGRRRRHARGQRQRARRGALPGQPRSGHRRQAVRLTRPAPDAAWLTIVVRTPCPAYPMHRKSQPA